MQHWKNRSMKLYFPSSLKCRFRFGNPTVCLDRILNFWMQHVSTTVCDDFIVLSEQDNHYFSFQYRTSMPYTMLVCTKITCLWLLLFSHANNILINCAQLMMWIYSCGYSSGLGECRTVCGVFLIRGEKSHILIVIFVKLEKLTILGFFGYLCGGVVHIARIMDWNKLSVLCNCFFNWILACYAIVN